MLSGEKSDVVTNVYEELRDVVNKNSKREIRFIEAGFYTLEQRFEKIMNIQERCKQQLDFLEAAILLWKGKSPDVPSEQKIAKVYEDLKAIVNNNFDIETRLIGVGSTQEQSFEDVKMKHNNQIAFLDMAMLLLENYNPEGVEEKQEVAMAS